MNVAIFAKAVTVNSPNLEFVQRAEEKQNIHANTHTHTLPSKKKEPVSVCPRAASCVRALLERESAATIWAAVAAEEQRR